MLKSIEYVDISAWFAWVLVIVLAVQFASGPKRGAQYLFLLFFLGSVQTVCEFCGCVADVG